MLPKSGWSALSSIISASPRQPSVGCRAERACRILTALIFVLAASGLTSAIARAETAVPVVLGHSTADLNGPWRFHVGDNPAWSDPKFDDSGWETVDLTAPPGAHDDDVGLTGYIPGWGARGHAGYSSYAWYRLRLAVDSPPGATLALAGPPAVDSAYQLFVDGKLIGSAGRFTGPTPMVFSIQPRMYALGQHSRVEGAGDPTLLIAFRVWMGPWDLGDPGAGGIHVAPVIGETRAVRARYEVQWLETVRGYIVEVIEALAFLLLATMVWGLRAFDRDDPAYPWLIAAMILLALYRANQAVFFWGQFETVHAFELVSVVLLIPLYMAAWTMSWRSWFRLPDMRWFRPAVAATLAITMGAQFFSRSWFHGVFPWWFNRVAHFGVLWSRLVFLGLTALIIYRAIRQGREAWFALPALVLVSIGLFAQELSQLGVKGIWFPFGTGVSRTQFAYAAFDIVLFALLWRRLQVLAERHRALAADAGAQVTRSSLSVESPSPGRRTPLADR